MEIVSWNSNVSAMRVSKWKQRNIRSNAFSPLFVFVLIRICECINSAVDDLSEKILLMYFRRVCTVFHHLAKIISLNCSFFSKLYVYSSLFKMSPLRITFRKKKKTTKTHKTIKRHLYKKSMLFGGYLIGLYIKYFLIPTSSLLKWNKKRQSSTEST